VLASESVIEETPPGPVERHRALRFVAPGLTFAICLGASLRWTFLSELLDGLSVRTLAWIHACLAAGAWLAGAWFVTRLVELTFWDRFVAPRLGGAVPSLIKSLGTLIIFLIAIGGFIGITLGYSVTGFWATSGVVGIIIGLALQSMIADVFSGIAINVDRPFAIGHWIRLQPRGSDPLVGQVEEVSWRSTRLRTIDNVTHIIPNNLLGVLVVTNLSLPETTSRFELVFCIDFAVSPDRVLRILNAGVRAAEGVLEDPAPNARIDGVSEHGVEYHVHYWLRPDVVSPHKGRHLVTASVLKHLGAAGIALAHPKQDLHVGGERNVELDLERDRSLLVRGIGLFEALDDEETERLAASMTQKSLGAGEVVIEKDEPGNSMFFVVEGLFSVLVPVEGQDEPLRVGQIGAGEFFGEMSLLTGAPRTATLCAVVDTVVFEITKDDIHEVITTRPEVARQMSRVVAAREAERADAKGRASATERAAEEAGMADRLLERINRFFGGARRRSA
jgi:small-conductance mechanosensitive channel